MKIKRAIILGWLTTMAVAGPATSSEGRGPGLSEAQMRSVVIAAVRAAEPEALRLAKFELLREDNHGGYAWFEAVADTRGSVHQGFVAIDPKTGDAWDGVSECGEITSPELKRLQGQLRGKMGLTLDAYSKIRRRGPMCDQPTVR